MKIILGSGSWLRKTILERSEFQFEVDAPEVDERAIESRLGTVSHSKAAVKLAEAKAQTLAAKYPNDIVVAADTFAVLPDGSRLHKPKDTKEALNLCLAQSGNTIIVITGMVVCLGKMMIKSVSKTKITYATFDATTISLLLENDDSTIRNSALGFFMDAPGFTLVKKFNGSYTGAMGLPMEILRENIYSLGYRRLHG